MVHIATAHDASRQLHGGCGTMLQHACHVCKCVQLCMVQVWCPHSPAPSVPSSPSPSTYNLHDTCRMLWLSKQMRYRRSSSPRGPTWLACGAWLCRSQNKHSPRRSSAACKPLAALLLLAVCMPPAQKAEAAWCVACMQVFLLWSPRLRLW